LAIEKAAGRWRPLIIAAIFTGMRASELRGLPWRDVDLDAGIIHQTTSGCVEQHRAAQIEGR